MFCTHTHTAISLCVSVRNLNLGPHEFHCSLYKLIFASFLDFLVVLLQFKIKQQCLLSASLHFVLCAQRIKLQLCSSKVMEFIGVHDRSIDLCRNLEFSMESRDVYEIDLLQLSNSILLKYHWAYWGNSLSIPKTF